VITVTHNRVCVLKGNQISVFFVKENLFIFNLTMMEVRSFLMRTVPAYRLEPEQTPAFKAQSNMTIFPRLLVIQFQLCTPEQMNSFVSKLQTILEQGHRVYQEMLAGHVPIQMGCLKVGELPLLILSNISSRPFRIAVIDAMKAVGLTPTKILTQNNGANVVDLYQNNENIPRFLDEVILGQYHLRQQFHQAQLDLVAARAEVRVSKENNIWYMTMQDSKHLNQAKVLKTKAELNQSAAPAPQKRSNPNEVIQKIPLFPFQYLDWWCTEPDTKFIGTRESGKKASTGFTFATPHKHVLYAHDATNFWYGFKPLRGHVRLSDFLFFYDDLTGGDANKISTLGSDSSYIMAGVHRNGWESSVELELNTNDDVTNVLRHQHLPKFQYNEASLLNRQDNVILRSGGVYEMDYVFCQK